MRERIREIIRQTCEEMGVYIVHGVLARDHVHMFLSTPPKLALSDVMRRIKGRSSRRIQIGFPELRRRYWDRRFWARGYFSTRQATSLTISSGGIWSYISPKDASGISRKSFTYQSAIDEAPFAPLDAGC